ncbi:MAG: glycosyl hydrolase-related protein, partial [Candidatus Bathyarchaeia archaeon]
ESHSGQLPLKYSFMEIMPDNAIVTAVKRAEDGDDIIIRVFESTGKECKAKLKFGFSVNEVLETDMVEWDKYVEPIRYPVRDNAVEIQLKPFEIKTLRVRA